MKHVVQYLAVSCSVWQCVAAMRQRARMKYAQELVVLPMTVLLHLLLQLLQQARSMQDGQAQRRVRRR